MRISDWSSDVCSSDLIGITLLETILAFAIGAGGGIVVGFAFARRALLAAVFDPYLKAANSLPRVVLAPIFALWFGLGIWSKVALGFTLVFFIVFRSEEHTSELQSLMRISYAVFCLKKK